MIVMMRGRMTENDDLVFKQRRISAQPCPNCVFSLIGKPGTLGICRCGCAMNQQVIRAVYGHLDV